MVETKALSFDSVARGFRNLAGQLIDKVQILLGRDKFLDREFDDNAELVSKLFGGKLSINEFVGEVQDKLKKEYYIQYTLGKGEALSGRDRQVLAELLQEQYSYLNKFAVDLISGRYTEEQAASVLARLNLYSKSSGQAYERAVAESYGPLKLPAYPRDGTTDCYTSCLCSWVFEEEDDFILATWELGETENHCTTCPERARRWVGLKFNRVTGEPVGDIVEINRGA